MFRIRRYRNVSLVPYTPLKRAELILMLVLAGIMGYLGSCLGEGIEERYSLAPDYTKWALKWPLIIVAIGSALNGYINLRRVALGCKRQCCHSEGHELIDDVQSLQVRQIPTRYIVAKSIFNSMYWQWNALTGLIALVPFVCKVFLGFDIPDNFSDDPAIKWVFRDQPQVSVSLFVFCTLMQLVHTYRNLHDEVGYTPKGMKTPLQNLFKLFSVDWPRCLNMSERAGEIQVEIVTPELENNWMRGPLNPAP